MRRLIGRFFCLGFLFRVSFSLSLRKFLVTRHIYTKKIKTRRGTYCERFFCASRLALCVFDVLLFAEREREGEESLFLSNNARICLHFVFLHIAKNEKFGLAKRTQRRMDVVF